MLACNHTLLTGLRQGVSIERIACTKRKIGLKTRQSQRRSGLLRNRTSECGVGLPRQPSLLCCSGSIEEQAHFLGAFVLAPWTEVVIIVFCASPAGIHGHF